ncbi:MAG: ATP-binding cassette domain-containing protein, partial [Candidatus Gracilibacteria bacterium]|nr:ATP-binding cassette domain-containing protein [Candidatus Gracilibacteria bacterium]
EAILVGSIVALYQYLERLNNAFFSVAWQWEGLIFRSTHVRSAETIVKAHQQYFRKHKRLSLPRKWKSIQITELNFRYEDDRNHVHHLKNIDLTLERGKRIALVGSSGSGKTTLMKLLRELDTPDSARVLIDGKSFPDLTVLNQTTTLFPQDPEIFENSIEYNITAGISHRTEEVINAVRLAKFDAVVERLPQGLDSHIQEKGVNLSGGEKQRLSLARGIFAARDSSIILLDEPTSSVDTINEREIYENLFQHFKSQCIVSSIHRLHLLPLFDMIYVLQRGEVVEKGTFDQLRNNPGGVLNKMWEQYRVSAKG